MAHRQLLRLAGLSTFRQTPLSSASRVSALRIQRFGSSPQRRDNKDDPFHESSTATLGLPGGEHEGSVSRTDSDIVLEYPKDEEFPVEPPVQGRGGPHLKRTLPQFSLEGKVGIVTGGARGLGFVMGQALVASGADLAIVDLNSKPQSSI